jgi:hypothetical protein
LNAMTTDAGTCPNSSVEVNLDNKARRTTVAKTYSCRHRYRAGIRMGLFQGQ